MHPLFEGGSFEMLAQGAHDSGVMLILFWCIAFLRVTLIYMWLNCIDNGCFPSLSCLETRRCRSLRFILCWCGSATVKAIPVVNSVAESSKMQQTTFGSNLGNAWVRESEIVVVMGLVYLQASQAFFSTNASGNLHVSSTWCT